MTLEPATVDERWPLARRIALRFGVVYGALQILPFPGNALPWIHDWVDRQWQSLWHPLVDAFGHHVLGIADIPRQPTGSGDTTADWTAAAFALVLATLATAVWSVLDRRRAAYPRLALAARIVLRYALASIMLGYGLAKVFPLQFPAPGPTQLQEPVGHLSPMGMLWTFMGSSTAYVVFSGAAETLGAVLLFWRRTTTLGALILAGVLANVVALNFCYDVPVKLFSTQLLVAALVLVWPDARRLVAVVLGGAAAARPPRSALPRRWRIAKLVGKLAFIGYLGFGQVRDELEAWHTYGPNADNHALVGTWLVDKFVRDGKDLGPRDDDARWQRVAFGRGGVMIRPTIGDDLEDGLTVDDEDHQVMMPTLLGGFRYTLTDRDHVALDGALKGAQLHVELHRGPADEMQLVTRGFHWVQEFPYNR